jgi:magnesium-transporting ATPase (P-type)
MEKPDSRIMERPPRPPREPVITRARGLKIASYGALFAISMGAGFGYMLWGEAAPLDEARTVAFFIACFSQMLFALGCRSEGLTYSQVGLFTNRALLGAILISATLQTSTVAIPALRPIFGTAPLALEHWVLVGLLALLPITVIEVAKLVRAATHPNRS